MHLLAPKLKNDDLESMQTNSGEAQLRKQHARRSIMEVTIEYSATISHVFNKTIEHRNTRLAIRDTLWKNMPMHTLQILPTI